jgi:hypothetical protein
MTIDDQDLRHCHKVLSSDVEECRILSDGAEGGRLERLQKRMEDDKRVLARIEAIIGYRPEYDLPAAQQEDVPNANE